MGSISNSRITTGSRGNFNLGFRHLTTSDFFAINVAMVKEVVATDKFHVSLHNAITNAPFGSQINGKFKVHHAAFYVPNRILFDGWHQYITGTGSQTLPYFDYKHLSSADRGFVTQMGLGSYKSPVDLDNVDKKFKVSALPFRAVNKIIWDYYRDPLTTPDSRESSYCFTTGGEISLAERQLLFQTKYRSYGKNYFTECLHSPNGDPATNSYLNSSVPLAPASILNYGTSASSRPGTVSNVLPNYSQTDPENGATSSAEVNNIQALRASNAIQRWLEKTNILGGRLKDRLIGMFNSKASNDLMKMSTYITSNTTDLNLSASPSASATGVNGTYTSAFGQDRPANNMSKGQLSTDSQLTSCGIDFDFVAPDHGFLVVLFTICPDELNYQGIDRMFMRGLSTHNASHFDFFHEELEGMGMQPLYYTEVVNMPGTSMGTTESSAFDPLTVFGYTERYADYKYSHDILSGDLLKFNSSMQNMHLGRDLLQEFGITDASGNYLSGQNASKIIQKITRDSVHQASPSSRSFYDKKFIVTDYDHFICDMKIDISANRPMTSNSIPEIDKISGSSVVTMGGGHL